jgi:hypothetical protein
MVHCLGFRQLWNWRKDSESITCKHNDVLWMTTDARNLGIWDILDRICTASILSQWAVSVINLSCAWMENDVLQDWTKFDSIKDLWFLFSGQIYTLGVTTTLNVEDAIVRPTVFIVSDEITMYICRQCSFPSSWKTEKEGNVSVRAL